jgi:hypothetical protein
MPRLRRLRVPGRRLILAVLAASVALYPACGGGSGGGLTEPTTGAIQIATSTTGTEPDADGYTLTIDEVESGVIGPAARRTIAELEPGAHQVGLSGVAPNCEVQGENPRTVSVVAGETADEAFAVACAQPPPETGGLAVTTTTTGVSPDADGYTVTVDGNPAGSIESEGALSVADLGAGDHVLGLAGVAANCSVEGDNPRAVAVVAGSVVAVPFSVECEAPPPSAGTLTVTTETSGAGADPDGYAFTIGDGDAQPIGATASVSVGGVAVGATEVALSGLAANCRLDGANPRPVTVPADGTVEVVFAVTCSPGTGTLVIATESNGEPADPSGYSLSVDGAAAVPIGINARQTFDGLAPGVYTVSLGGLAANCSLQGQSSRSVTVTASQTTTLTFQVACATATGSLTVTVSGLPAATDAAVTVTGPGALRREVTATTTLEDLPPGQYTVVAASVSAGGSTYTATPTTRAVDVTAGATVTVAIGYTATAGPTLNLSIAGVLLTQSVQRFDNTVPLVAGREALLRVTGLANSSNRVTAQVRVRLFQGNDEVGNLLLESPADTVPTARFDGDLTTTWNTLVDGSLIQSGLRVVAEVDPANAVPEANESDNVFPATGRLAPEVRTPPPLAITLVPVRQTATGLQGDVTTSNRREYVDLASRMYPLSGYDARVRSVYISSAPALQPDDANQGWLTLVNEIGALQVADPEGRHYYGVVRLSYSAGRAGLSFNNVGVSVGYDDANDRGRIAAHELGHTWGRDHAPCGNPAGPDPNYPYPNGTIGRIGYDPLTGTLKPRETPDIMSNCGDPWISDYTYEGVMQFRGTVAGRASRGVPGPALLVWGRIVDGRAVLEPAFRIVSRAALPRRPGPYAVEGTAADGSRIFGFTFDAAEVADHPRGGRQFAFAVPLAGAEASRLEQLRLSGPGIGMAAVSRSPAALRTAPAEPVRMVPAAEGASLQWDAAAYPMVMVRDERSGEVISFARGGRVTVPSAAGLELVASDGVRSRTVSAAR